MDERSRLATRSACLWPGGIRPTNSGSRFMCWLRFRIRSESLHQTRSCIRRHTAALCTLGAYGYHFCCMRAMGKTGSRSGDQYLHRKTDQYRDAIRCKPAAYHRFIQIALISQGVLQCIATTTPAPVFTNTCKLLILWGGRRDSNPRPPEPQSGALPS